LGIIKERYVFDRTLESCRGLPRKISSIQTRIFPLPPPIVGNAALYNMFPAWLHVSQLTPIPKLNRIVLSKMIVPTSDISKVRFKFLVIFDRDVIWVDVVVDMVA
jgi:hypothetical protein